MGRLLLRERQRTDILTLEHRKRGLQVSLKVEDEEQSTDTAVCLPPPQVEIRARDLNTTVSTARLSDFLRPHIVPGWWTGGALVVFFEWLEDSAKSEMVGGVGTPDLWGAYACVWPGSRVWRVRCKLLGWLESECG